jgi:hypothetical protein
MYNYKPTEQKDIYTTVHRWGDGSMRDQAIPTSRPNIHNNCAKVCEHDHSDLSCLPMCAYRACFFMFTLWTHVAFDWGLTGACADDSNVRLRHQCGYCIGNCTCDSKKLYGYFIGNCSVASVDSQLVQCSQYDACAVLHTSSAIILQEQGRSVQARLWTGAQPQHKPQVCMQAWS